MNSLTVTGHLGKDSEIRYLPDGSAVCGFSIGDSQGKDKPTIWWSCSLFGKRAESLSMYLIKGTPVTVVGSCSQREYTDKDGNKRTSMDIRVSDVALQGKRDSQEPARQAAPRPQPARTAPAPSGGFDDMDDDVPF